MNTGIIIVAIVLITLTVTLTITLTVKANKRSSKTTTKPRRRFVNETKPTTLSDKTVQICQDLADEEQRCIEYTQADVDNDLNTSYWLASNFDNTTGTRTLTETTSDIVIKTNSDGVITDITINNFWLYFELSTCEMVPGMCILIQQPTKTNVSCQVVQYQETKCDKLKEVLLDDGTCVVDNNQILISTKYTADITITLPAN